MKKPNLFILGAQKSGTSTLYRMLEQHPDILLSKQKELNFFNQPSISDEGFEGYLSNFSGYDGEKFVGEATPHYFTSNPDGSGKSMVANRMLKYIGLDITFLLIMRNPVERTLAAWRHNYIHGHIDENTSIFDAPSSQGIINLSHYKRHWDAWVSIFPEENFKVYTFDELKGDSKSLLKNVLNDLNLEFRDQEYSNFPFNRAFNSAKQNMERNDISDIPGFDRDLIEKLMGIFDEDIKFVESRVNQALPNWRDVEALVKKFSNPGR